MLKISTKELARMESDWPGLQEQVLRFDAAPLPACRRCGSGVTAAVTVGSGRPNVIASCTSKLWPILNGPVPGAFWCHHCEDFFDPVIH